MNLDRYNIRLIASILNTELIGNQDEKSVHQFVLDSRKNANPVSSLFVCLKGKRHNAHEFIPELYSQGFRMFLIEEELNYSDFPEATFLRTPSTLIAFQSIATHHRSTFQFPIIGITGSYGKTIIKEWLFQLLQDDFQIVRSPKSYNSQIGLPLSLFQIKPYHNLGLFEAGISEKGEMKRLGDILKCDIAILSNIGNAHIENFNDQSEILDEKSLLSHHAKTVICSEEYRGKFSATKEVLSWGKRADNFLQIIIVKKDAKYSKLNLVYDEKQYWVVIPFIDDYSLQNILHCIVSMLHMNYTMELIIERVKRLKPVALRLQMKQGVYDSIIINDPYLKDAESLQISVDFLRQQKGYSKYILIHDSEEDLVISEFSEKIDQIISIGPNSTSAEHYKNVQDFVSNKDLIEFKDSAILIQGDFSHGIDKLSQSLQEKTHQTIMEINLNHLVDNLNYFKSKLKSSTKVMAMVKAFSYGSGSDEIASILQYHKIDYLGVAYADEGLSLRKAGITLPIMVMNPEPSAFDSMIKNHLSPVIYNAKSLGLFITAIEKFDDIIDFPIHVELETGMHRLGFSEQEIKSSISELSHPKVKIDSIFSHLAASENENKKDFTLHQINSFIKTSDELIELLDYKIDRHILNSNGILNYPEFQMDMVRLGIGLYGICDSPDDQKMLKEVSSLKTSISQIKTVPAESSVGYGANSIGSTSKRIAVLPIGYADGFRRSLSNEIGQVFINNQKASVIGKVCMDMTMVDVSNIQCDEGDEVIVFNQKYSIRNFAESMNTIPYEALTGISPRVKRVYLQE